MTSLEDPGLCLSFRGNSFHGQCQVLGSGSGSVRRQPPMEAERGAAWYYCDVVILLVLSNIEQGKHGLLRDVMQVILSGGWIDGDGYRLWRCINNSATLSRFLFVFVLLLVLQWASWYQENKPLWQTIDIPDSDKRWAKAPVWVPSDRADCMCHQFSINNVNTWVA